MPHLNDPKLAAQLLSGISFTINHTSRGDFSLQHVKYDCTLSYGDGENDILHTSYQSVPSIHGEPSLTDVMMSLTSDAMVASDYDIDTFADEFGYAKPSQAIRAYEGCKKSLEWLRDSLGIFAYYPSTQQTNFAFPSFCLAPATDAPDTMDIQGAIEQTMHDLLDYGATADDLWQIMGLTQEAELDSDYRDTGEFISVDLGYCIEGDLLGFEKLDPDTTDVHDILTDEQIAHIEEWADALSAKDVLPKAAFVAHDPTYKKPHDEPVSLADEAKASRSASEALADEVGVDIPQHDSYAIE